MSRTFIFQNNSFKYLLTNYLKEKKNLLFFKFQINPGKKMPLNFFRNFIWPPAFWRRFQRDGRVIQRNKKNEFRIIQKKRWIFSK